MDAVVVKDSTPRLRKSVFGIQGMTCSACTNTIQDTVNALPSVQEASVSLLNNSMRVTYDANAIDSSQLRELVEDLGYEATEWESSDAVPSEKVQPTGRGERILQIHFQDISTLEDLGIVNAYLSSLPLQLTSAVTLPKCLATIRYTPSGLVNVRTILRGVPHPFRAALYYPPSVYSRSREIQRKEAKKTLRLFLASAVFAVPTFVIGVVGMLLLPEDHPFRVWCTGMGWWGGLTRSVLILFVLATLVQFGIARVFFVHGWKSLRFRKGWSAPFRFGNMNLLVALSTGVAYVASVIMMVIDIRTDPKIEEEDPDMQTYFDSVVFLTFFILAGKALEARAKLKTGDAIAMLGQLRPERALLLGNEPSSPVDLKSQRTEDIPVDMLEIGDIILVRPGSSPPADGIVYEGTTTVDESSLTGESIPVTKNPGDSILTGTMVKSSPVTMEVTNLGDETMLQQIVRAVGESQDSKAPIEELADRITGVFVPFIIYLSIVVSIIWLSVALTPNGMPITYLEEKETGTGDRIFFALGFSIAVLAVACPCGIGLAAPAAQAVGAGMAAKMGILAQGGGTAFQLATNVDAVVFDKTGTLTQGTPSVVGIKKLRDEEWLLDAVSAIEQTSSHPLAAALVRYADGKGHVDDEDEIKEKKKPENGVEVVEIEEIAGKGTLGVIRVREERHSFRLGNLALMGDVKCPDSHKESIDNWKKQGYSVVYFALSSTTTVPGTPSEVTEIRADWSIVAAFAIADPARPEAKRIISALEHAGKRVYMLSGDNETTARTVGKELGIVQERIVAGVLPHEKAAFIQDLKSKTISKGSSGRWPWSEQTERPTIVMFAGDGLNDSAAVAGADIGVAFAHGSQITLTSASFVLLQTHAPLQGVLDIITLSKKVYRRQKFNFAWAMIYNIILIPLAAGSFYSLNKTRIPPVWAALAMALSSLSVVASSLALRWGL